MLVRSGKMIHTTALMQVFCFCCFTIHITLLSVDYFAYETVTRIQRPDIASFKAANVAACFRYTEIFDFDNFDKYTGTRRANALTRLTIRNVLRYTPAENDSADSAAIRDHTDLTMINLGREHTIQAFMIRKFVTGNLLCYEFRHKREKELSADRIRGTVDNPSLLFQLSLKQRPDIEYMKVAVFHEEDDLPIVLENGHEMERTETGSRKKVRPNIFSFSYKWTETRLLEPPFDSACSTEKKSFCMDECLRPELSDRMNRIPFRSTVYADSDDQSITQRDLLDYGTREGLFQAYHQCESVCSAPACDEVRTVTLFTGSKEADEGGKNDNITIRLMAPQGIETLTSIPAFPLHRLLSITFLSISYATAMSMLLTACNKKERRRLMRRNRVKRFSEWSE